MHDDRFPAGLDGYHPARFFACDFSVGQPEKMIAFFTGLVYNINAVQHPAIRRKKEKAVCPRS